MAWGEAIYVGLVVSLEVAAFGGSDDGWTLPLRKATMQRKTYFRKIPGAAKTAGKAGRGHCTPWKCQGGQVVSLPFPSHPGPTSDSQSSEKKAALHTLHHDL